MAGDGLVTENDHICMTDYQKVRRLKDGSLVGLSGDAYNWQAFGDWLDTGGEGEPPKVEGTFSCLVLHPDGQLLSYDQHGRSFPEAAPCAIGSGTRFALAWMDAGHSAADAVEYACKRDIYSGGKITVLELHPKAELEAVA